MAGALSAFAAPAPPPLIAAPAPSAVAQPAQGGPRIAFPHPIYEAGMVKPGQMIRHDFVFTNRGNSLLRIESVRPSCGCTTAGQWTHQVKPGQSGKIAIQVDSTHLFGNFTKTVLISSNDPHQPMVVLQIRGKIWTPIEISPRAAIFSSVTSLSSNRTKVITISNQTKKPVELSDAKSSNPAFGVKIKTVVPGKQFQLAIGLTRALAQGLNRGEITVKTSSPDMPQISIETVVYVMPPIQLMPDRIFMTPGASAKKSVRYVIVMNHEKTPLTLAAPKINQPGIDLSMKEVMPGKRYIISLTFPKGFQLAPTNHTVLTLKSTQPEGKVFKVPLVLYHPYQH